VTSNDPNARAFDRNKEVTLLAVGEETWLFDVDGTLVDSFDAEHLRPLVRDVFGVLHARGECIAVWSAGGVDHARNVMVRHRLDHHICAFHDKVIGIDGFWMLAHIRGSGSIVCVDDQPSLLPTDGERLIVFPYLRANAHDRAFVEVLARAKSGFRKDKTCQID
jgi:hypothetical protein